MIDLENIRIYIFPLYLLENVFVLFLTVLFILQICDGIEELAVRLHVSFQDVISKFKEWFANGVSIATMPIRIVKWIWQQFWGQVYDTVAKRSLDSMQLHYNQTLNYIINQLSYVLIETKWKYQVCLLCIFKTDPQKDL